jgi:hypothetical protein
VVVRVQSPLTVSVALRGLDGKKAEAPNTPRNIPVLGSEWLLRFSLTVWIARCQTTHLAPLIFSELGQKSPFLAADLEARPALLPLKSGGEITVNVLPVGVPAAITASHHPIEQRWMPPPVGHLHRPGVSLTCAGACLGLLLCHDAGLRFFIGVGLCNTPCYDCPNLPLITIISSLVIHYMP